VKILACIVLTSAGLLAADDTLLIRGATIHPVTAPEIQNGSILVRDGKITGVGKNLAAPKGAKIIEAKGLHVYPGIIDSATEIGLEEVSAVRETADTGELGLFNPQLRAEIAVNPSSEHIPVARANGITSVITLPMSAGGGDESPRRGGNQPKIITGQAALIHLDGWTWEEMDVKQSAAMAMLFPAIASASSRFSDAPASMRGATYADAKKNFDTQMRELKEFFEQARRYQKAKASGTPLKPDLKFEAMLPVLEGKEPMVAVTPRERAIKDAVKFADDQKIKLILADVKELGAMGPELKQKGIPVILGPTLALPLHEDDPYDAAYALPEQFYKAGIKFAFGSFGNEFVRNLPYQAATAVAFGLPYEEALKAITVNAAEIWGVADRIGAIEEGKYADLILTDGDPLETKTQVKQVFIKGKNIDPTDNKQYRLYQKYLNRP
jgi:imidazolonepropionase-like amidohydrolase